MGLGLAHFPRPIEPPRKRYALNTLAIVLALGFCYLVWA